MTTRFTLNAQILVTAAALAASAIGANGLTVDVHDGTPSHAAAGREADDDDAKEPSLGWAPDAAPASRNRRAIPAEFGSALWEHGQMSGSGYDCSACVERVTGGEKSEWDCDALRGNTPPTGNGPRKAELFNQNSVAGLLNFEQKLTGRLDAHELPWECGGHSQGEPNCLEAIIDACTDSTQPTPQVFVFLMRATVEQDVTSAVAAGNANVKEIVAQLLEERGSNVALIVINLKQIVAELDAGEDELRAFYCEVIVELGGSCDAI